MSADPTTPHGPASPLLQTPARPGTRRRITSTDILAPVDLGDRWPAVLELVGTARDGVVADHGSLEVLGRADTWVRIDGDRVVAVRTDPELAAAQDLVGAPARSGFRAALGRALPDHQRHRTATHLLLDDVPVTALISGYRVLSERPDLASPDIVIAQPDLCSGWRRDGVMFRSVDRTGALPNLPGAPLPFATGVDAACGWSALAPARPASMRRLRRIDVSPGDGATSCTAWFRDIHVRPDGDVRVLHEYELHAVITGPQATVRELRAEPRVLPWPECPLAAASVERLVGTPVAELPERVRGDLGTSTCTHLNDLLRSLGDVPALRH